MFNSQLEVISIYVSKQHLVSKVFVAVVIVCIISIKKQNKTKHPQVILSKHETMTSGKQA